MTIVRRMRCGHCGVIYSYKASGSGRGGNWKWNSAEHCPECNEAITLAVRAAKAKIPVLFEHKWVETDAVTPEELHSQIEENNKKPTVEVKEDSEGIKGLKFNVHRVWPAMVRADGSAFQQIRSVVKDGVNYRFSYWPDDPSDYQIEVMRWVELATGKQFESDD